MNIIVVSDAHKMPAPLLYNLGEHSLIITSDYGAPDAFELAAPAINEETLEVSPDSPQTAIFDEEETYRLYQCLHTLFQPVSNDE
jgi:hypothetical protein